MITVTSRVTEHCIQIAKRIYHIRDTNSWYFGGAKWL